MEIIVINGFSGVGKDTFIEFCKAIKGENMVKSYSTIDPIKAFAKSCGWNGEKDEHSRKALSDLKKILSNWLDYSFLQAKKEIEDYKYLLESYNIINDGIFIIQSREPEEIERFKKEFGAITLLIESKKRGKKFNNYSDSNVLSFNYDYIIQNDKLPSDLYYETKKFLCKIEKRGKT